MKDKLQTVFNGISNEWIERFAMEFTTYDSHVLSIQLLASALYNHEEDGNNSIPEIHEKTLTYLYPLLKDKKLVAGRIRRRDENTPPKSIDEVRGKPVYEDIPGESAEEIIEYIRGNWNNNPEFSEMFDCVFKLPEQEWPCYQ